MTYVYLSDLFLASAFIVIVLIIVCLLTIINLVVEYIEKLQMRIVQLAKAAQHAEIHTGIPYYTGSGTPINYKMERADAVYTQVEKTLTNYMTRNPVSK
jgi:hypothetical protein